MNKKQWFLFFMRRSISQRKGRLAIASVSVAIAVSLITAMAAITTGIKERLGSELKAYGANIIISPKGEDYLSYDHLNTIAGLSNIEYALGQIFGIAYMKKRQVEIIGLDVEKLKDAGWRLFGSIIQKNGEVLIGTNIKNAFEVKIRDSISLTIDNRKMDFIVSGFFEKGGAEDSAIVMSMPDAWNLIGKERLLNVILARGKTGELEMAVKSIQKAIPSAIVKTIRQVVFAEESLLNKIQLLMALITSVVLLASAISIASTMGANVLQRRQEIGLMKAIGATKRDVEMFYIAEAILTGIIGGLAGFALGIAVAQAVSKGAFNSFIPIHFYIPFISVFTGMAVSLVASYIPVKSAIKYNPALILRGE